MNPSIGLINNKLKFVYNHDSEVSFLDKSFEVPFTEENAKIARVQLTLKNNSGLTLRSNVLEDFSLRDTSHNPFTVFYPPPSSKHIVSIVTCPYDTNHYLMHIETGEICRFYLQQRGSVENAYIEEIFSPAEIQDFRGHAV
jgi:hypothetical protein